MVAPLGKFSKSHWIACLKLLNFMICQIYINKAVKQRNNENSHQSCSIVPGGGCFHLNTQTHPVKYSSILLFFLRWHYTQQTIGVPTCATQSRAITVSMPVVLHVDAGKSPSSPSWPRQSAGNNDVLLVSIMKTFPFILTRNALFLDLICMSCIWTHGSIPWLLFSMLPSSCHPSYFFCLGPICLTVISPQPHLNVGNEWMVANATTKNLTRGTNQRWHWNKSSGF